MKSDNWTLQVLLLATSVFLAEIAFGQQQKDRTWSVYKADAGSSNYSPLDQINVSNVGQLKPAWTLAIKDNAAGTRPSQCNPIIVDGIMYATSASQRAYAVDAATGKQIWSFDPFNGKESGGEVNRGLTYWEKEARTGAPDRRILFTANNQLFALNAATGKPVTTFGKAGKVDMRIGLRDNNKDIYVSSTSPGIIYKDLIIMGCRVPDVYGSQPGYIRAYSCLTGKLVWTFHTVPMPGESGYETWSNDAYKVVGGVNNWAGMSLDRSRGMVFLALVLLPMIFMEPTGKGKTCMATACSHWMRPVENIYGIFRPCITTCGTTIFLRHPTLLRSNGKDPTVGPEI